jgi:hypothetical protein
MLAQALLATSAAIILTLGVVHLLYTFRTSKFHPRDPELEARLKAVSPVISRETTMWKAWVGFNASHGFGAVFFRSGVRLSRACARRVPREALLVSRAFSRHPPCSRLLCRRPGRGVRLNPRMLNGPFRKREIVSIFDATIMSTAAH